MSDEAAGDVNASVETTRAQDWWRDLDKRDRAAKARLKRADFDAAVIDEATLRLFRYLGRRRRHDLSRVAALAMVLAAVRQDTGRNKTFARHIGFSRMPADPQRPEADNKPVLSVLRFKRLMSTANSPDPTSDDLTELARQFRRAVDLLGGSANVEDIKNVLLGWHRQETRRDFAFEYYGAGIASPLRGAAPDPESSSHSSEHLVSA
ncbi:type I-E CRISPR-associated protein Cse2/CasB [Rhodoplanes roseus]|uniref:Type I-E CRISPR-associated protein Cse2/CasB n=1 Tax=Rhodoplanes roseus TaxID=29409 RepID=A0A327KV78_9BRAD|nr:type I-E CRISPR-associated protein Cse2/CasB [Rhodoplanes roseus]RAI42739.1 type I-E CRISPR-associated protein Cse2/CasB [Rhodoplanes roseus]